MLMTKSLVFTVTIGLATAQDGSVQTQINSIAEQNSDIAFALAPNMTQWQYLLLPTPTVVKLIGQMVVLSSKVDVSLAEQRPEKGWQFVSNPASLRASLLQVGNEGWSAFQVAHAKMSHVSLTMRVVPKHVRTALRVLGMSSVPASSVLRLIRSPLSAIQRAGESCVADAVATSDAFLNVMGLTAELSTAVAGAQGANDVDIVEAKAQLEATKTQKELMDEQKDFMMQRYEEQKKVVNEARAAYEKAIRKIPTGFKAFAMDFLQTMGPSLVGAMAGIPILPNFGGFGKGGGGGGSGGGASYSDSTVSQDVHDPVILQTVRTVADRLPEIRRYVQEAIDEGSELGADEIRDFFLTVKTMFTETVERFDSYPNTALKVLAQTALKALVKVAEGLEGRMTNMADELSEEAKEAVLGKVEEVAASLDAIVAAGIQTGDAGGMRLPGRGGGGGGGVGANERFIASSRLENLGGAERSLDSIFKDINAFNQQLTEVEVRMSQINLRRLSLEQVRELLRQVLAILGQIRQLWSRLVQFFTVIATRAKVLNENYVKVFQEMTAESGAIVAEGASAGDRAAFVSLLQEQALDLSSVSHLLHTMAVTYVRVSESQVLNKLAGLASLLAARDDEERDRWYQALDVDAKEARAEIMALIRRQKEDYARAILAKRQRLMDAIAAMGGVTDRERAAMEAGKEIAAEVRSGGSNVADTSGDDVWDMSSLV